MIAAKIIEYRNRTGIRQATLARMVGISGVMLHKIENNLSQPTLDLWLKLAAIIGLNEVVSSRMWLRERLPPRLRYIVTLDAPVIREENREGLSRAETIIADTCEELGLSIDLGLLYKEEESHANHS